MGAARGSNLPGVGKDRNGVADAQAVPVAVIDTNAWLDLFVFRDPQAQPLALALQQRQVRVVRSGRTDAELQAVLLRPVFAARCDDAAREALLNHWTAIATDTLAESIRPSPLSCRDRDDQKFLDLAFSTDAAWLFTKDRALLDLARKARRAGLLILAPAMFAATRSSARA
jgi:putative PIN family toxin of toxin-antitoxin system